MKIANTRPMTDAARIQRRAASLRERYSARVSVSLHWQAVPRMDLKELRTQTANIRRMDDAR